MTESWKQTDLSNTTTTDQYQYILGLLPMQEGDGKLPLCRLFWNVFFRICRRQARTASCRGKYGKCTFFSVFR